MKEIKNILSKSGSSIIFVLFLIVFSLAFLLVPAQETSTTENRPLQQKPKVTLSSVLEGNYQEDMSSYLSDQFLLRSSLVKIHTNLEHQLGKSEINGVYIGEDDELFQESVVPDKDMIKQKLDTINAFVQNQKDIRISMILAPNKATILEDKLPSNIPGQNQQRTMESFHDGLDKSIQYVNVTSALSKHKKEGLYYRSDHHWTNRGAYVAFNTWKQVVLPDEALFTYETYCVNGSFYGTLANTSGYFRGKGDCVEIVTSKEDPKYVVKYAQNQTSTTTIFDAQKANSTNPYEVFLSGNQPLIDISTTVENQRHLLLIKDSYANSFLSYLLPYYNQITIVDPRYYYEDLSQLIKDRSISDILFLYNANTFFSDTSLQSLLKDTQEAG